jgi:hypothetical protein
MASDMPKFLERSVRNFFIITNIISFYCIIVRKYQQIAGWRFPAKILKGFVHILKHR